MMIETTEEQEDVKWMLQDIHLESMMHLYFIESFTFDEISYIQELPVRTVRCTIVNVLRLVEAMFHLENKRIATACITIILLTNMQQSTLTKEQSQRMYQRIMVSTKGSKEWKNNIKDE